MDQNEMIEQITSALKGHAIEAAAECLYGSTRAMVAEDVETILASADRSAAVDQMVEASLAGYEEVGEDDPDGRAVWTSYGETLRAWVCK